VAQQQGTEAAPLLPGRDRHEMHAERAAVPRHQLLQLRLLLEPLEGLGPLRQGGEGRRRYGCPMGGWAAAAPLRLPPARFPEQGRRAAGGAPGQEQPETHMTC
jgi:hypothetical protein